MAKAPPPGIANFRSSFPVAMSQTRTVPSELPVKIWRPSEENAADLTSAICPIKRRISTPLEASQRRTLLSLLAVAIVRPSGEKLTLLIEAVCPTIRRSCRPDETSQSLTDQSEVSVMAIVLPLGENAVEPPILPMSDFSLPNLRNSSPVETSRIWADSQLAVTMNFPSEEKSIDCNLFLCSPNRRISRPEPTSHNTAFPSWPAVRTVRPSGENVPVTTRWLCPNCKTISGRSCWLKAGEEWPRNRTNKTLRRLNRLSIQYFI